MERLAGFLAELKRRQVYRVAAAYAVAAWLIVQIAATVLPIYDAPRWVLRGVVTLLILGFPIALLVSWAYELTPQGLRRDEDVAPGAPSRLSSGRRIDFAIITLLVVALGYFVVTREWGDARVEDVAAESATRAAPRASAADARSVAVLPFANLSRDAENEYFAEGLADTMIHVLSRVGELRVVARNSSFQFKGRNVDVREIGTKLGVATVLEGSVQRSGDRLRIFAQLVDAQRGTAKWSNTFDRRMTDVFEIQDEIANEVVKALAVGMAAGGGAPDRPGVGTRDLEAYQAYLRGRQKISRRTAESLREAVTSFEEALRRDPRYAVAHAGIAEAHAIMFQNGIGTSRRGDVEAAARRALALDPNCGEAHAALGLIELLGGNPRAAVEPLQRAVALAPSHTPARSWLTNALLANQRPDEAVAAARAAAELDPLDPIHRVRLGYAFRALGRSDDAVAATLGALGVDPGFPVAYGEIANYHRSLTGRLDDSVRWDLKGQSLDPANPRFPTQRAFTLLDLGDQAGAAREVQRAVELGPMHDYALSARMLTELHRADCASAMRTASTILAKSSRNLVAFTALPICARKSQPYSGILGPFRRGVPELFEEPPQVDGANWRHAIELARAHAVVGQQDRARRLVDAILPVLRAERWQGDNGRSMWEPIALSAVRDREGTLAALRRVLASGVRGGAERLKVTESFDFLRDDPEFKQIMKELDAEFARMRESLRQRPELTEEEIRRAIESGRL